MNSSRFASRSMSRAVFGALLLVPALCFAHVGADAGAHHGAAAALAAGFVHPFTGLDHLAAMLVLGVWSALTAKRIWLAPLVFAATLAIGAVTGLAGVALPSVEPMIAASLLALGLLLATGAKLPAIGGAAVAALFALFHGAAHGQELAGHDALFAIGGMVVATALLHAAGIGLGLALKNRNVWLPRVAGAAVALFGVSLLAPLLAGLA
ncbi:MAG: HupE/UreJ family protein [Burkholderiales bacterium]